MVIHRRCGTQRRWPMQTSVMPHRLRVEHLDAVEHIAASVVTLPLERIVEWFVCAAFFSKLDIGDVCQAVTRRSDAASLPDGDAGLLFLRRPRDDRCMRWRQRGHIDPEIFLRMRERLDRRRQAMTGRVHGQASLRYLGHGANAAAPNGYPLMSALSEADLTRRPGRGSARISAFGQERTSARPLLREDLPDIRSSTIAAQNVPPPGSEWESQLGWTVDENESRAGIADNALARP